MEKIIKVTSEEADKIIENRVPYGLFYLKDIETGRYVGIDNRSGDAWVEEFETLTRCKTWLRS